MLTHELNNFTMSEAVKFYDQLASTFSSIVPFGVALNDTDPYFEGGYSLPSFEECRSSDAEYLLSRSFFPDIGGKHIGSITGNGTNADGPFTTPLNASTSDGSSSGGTGSSGGTSSSGLSNANHSGAAKISLDGLGFFVGALALVGGTMATL